MDIKQLVSIRIISSRLEDRLLTGQLAERLDLSSPADVADKSPFFLAYRDERLGLFEANDTRRAQPLDVDFLAGPSFYRYCHDRRINQPLCKAVGIKKGVRPTICDATAGFGEDGFVLASMGCRLVLVERSPVIWALLADGIRRAAAHPVIGELFARHITLHLGEATTFLENAEQSFDTIYVDPMYPAAPKSALNKQKMRRLRAIVGDDRDSPELLRIARTAALSRVAVKRPLRAPAVSPHPPDFTISGQSSRFDVYLC